MAIASGCGDPRPTSQPAGNAASPTSRIALSDDKAPAEPVEIGRFPGRIHLVQAGDTLYSLAERYYGHGKFYRKIRDANRNRLADPNELPAGMKLIIPP